jgi:putative copper export protein
MRDQYQFVVAPGAVGSASVDGVLPGEKSVAAMEDSMSGSSHHDPASMPEGKGFDSESPLYVVIRWLQYIALLLSVGAISFRYLALGFLRRDPLSEGEAAEPAFVAEADRRAAKIGHGAVGLLAVTLFLRLVAQSYAMHGAADFLNGGLVATMIAKTMWGWGWLLQSVGAIVAGVGFHRARNHVTSKSEGATPRSDTSIWWSLAAVGAVIAAFSPAFSGHAASAPKLRALAVLADGIHVLGASSWLGSLALLLLAGLPAIKHQAASVQGPLTRSLVNAFSPVALASAGVAMTTGVFAAWLHVGTIPNLWGTHYGVTLLIKLTVLGLVALTGFYNWRFVKPRLGTSEASARLQHSARIEVLIAVVVLLVTAVLVGSPTSMDMTM